MSEFSSLEDDEEPKKKKARKSKGSPVTGDKEPKTKLSSSSSKTTTTADSAETKLKKLKSLVTLCGTRKPWKKLFEDAGCPDLESGSDEQKTKARKGQITVVERTLLDLGMVRSLCLLLDLVADRISFHTDTALYKGESSRGTKGKGDQAGPGSNSSSK